MGRTNEFGYWGPGYPPTKPQGVLRIILLGDSYIEGLQLFDRDHLRTIIEKRLKQELQTEIEVLKVGYSGLNLETMYCYYRNLAKYFNPDYTLFFIKNPDVYNIQNVAYYPKVEVDSSGQNLKVIPISINSKIVKNKLFLQKYSGTFLFLTLIKSNLSLIQQGESLPILLGKFYAHKEITKGFTKTTDELSLSLKSKLIFKELGEIGNVGIVNLKELDYTSYTNDPVVNNILYIDPIYVLSDKQKKNFTFWKATKMKDTGISRGIYL